MCTCLSRHHHLLTSGAIFKAPRLCRRRMQYKCVAEGAVTTSCSSGPKASNGMSLAHAAVQGRPDSNEGLCLAR